VPVGEALAELKRLELVDEWPWGREPATVLLPEHSRAGDLRDAIERKMAWVLDGSEFRRFTGPVADDVADQAVELMGRPIPRVLISIRFVRVSGSLSLDDVSAGAVLFEYTGAIPDGYKTTFSNNQERSFVEGVQGLEGPTGVVRTTRKTISSGVTFDGRAVRMPGGFARLRGTLSVSAFVGRDLDRNTTEVPLTADLIRGQWTAVHLFSSLEAAAAFGFRGEGLTARVGGDRIRVDVRVQ
jgi:hypothetical protein